MLNLEGIRGKRIKSTKFYFFVKIQTVCIIFSFTRMAYA